MSSSDLPYERREELLFSEVAALPPEQRAGYLDVACNGDIQLRRGVERLLLSLDDDGFMQRAAAEDLVPEADSERAADRVEQAGERIGNYQLLERIGEGGFGVVWIAQQEEPVRREVALKIVKLGMDTKDVIARFDQERKALAMMEHPNIAKALDAGTTRTGRPYFVMELVRGVKVTEYCDRENISTPERLKLFVQICNAVQHAHQKGVIHRDLKPSNILVELIDGVPTPKVIDFGVAKATRRQRFTDLTVYTGYEQMIGTPLYMSPEQAQMNGGDIDTRSDIYSLGVLLYELLVGRPPFDPVSLMEAGFDEMRRVIREQEPRKPSTSIETMAPDARTTGARLRNTEPSRWVGHLRGDLDCIVMKALEKDRARRYDTASDFARDIERHLASEPVIARPPTASYRFRRFARRNRVMFTAGAAVLTAIIAGLAMSAWMFWKEKDARLRAVAAEKAQKEARLSAEKAAAKSQQIAKFLTDMLSGIDASVALGRDTTLLREILEKTAERVEDLKDLPEEEAGLREIIANAYFEISEYSNAEEMIRKAISLRRKTSDQETLELAYSLNELGSVLQAQGRSEEAEPIHREALAIVRRLVGHEDVSVARLLSSLGNAVEANGKWREAEAIYREALAMQRKLPNAESLDVSKAIADLAEMLFQFGQLAQAEQMYREACTIAEGVLPDKHPRRLHLSSRLAVVLASESKWDEAEEMDREAFTEIRRLYGENHFRTAAAKSRRAEMLINQGRLLEAEGLFRESLDVLQKQFGNEHPEVPRALVGLAWALEKSGDIKAAEERLRKAVEIQGQIIGPDHPRTARYLSDLGEMLQKRGKLSEAESMLREALRILRSTLDGDQCETAFVLVKLARVLDRAGKLEQAEKCYQEGIDLMITLFGAEHPIVAIHKNDLSSLFHRMHRWPEAEKLSREALEIGRKSMPEDSADVPVLMLNLAFELNAQKRLGEAESLYREALALRKKVLPIEHPEINSSYWALFYHLIRRSKFNEAEQLGLEALQIQQRHRGGDQPEVGKWFLQLGDLMVKKGRPADAEGLHRQSLSIARNDPNSKASDVEERIHRLADDLYRQGKYVEAEALYREEITSQRERSVNEQDQRVIGANASLARLLADWAICDHQKALNAASATSGQEDVKTKLNAPTEHAKEAVRLLRQCLKIANEAKKPDDWRLAEIRNRFGWALTALALTDTALAGESRRAMLNEAESVLLETQRALEINDKSERKYQRHALVRLVDLYQYLDRPSDLKMWQEILAKFDEGGSEFIKAEGTSPVTTE